MKNLIRFVFFCLLILSSSGHAKVCLISDVDDTLRVSHVKGKPLERFLNAFDFTAFPAIAEVFRQMAKGADAEVHYVSFAPHFYMKESHQYFLYRNGLPKGTMHLRRGQNSDHKLQTIRRILETSNCTSVIFFGDNADKDPMVYAQITHEFPNVEFATFIHQIYEQEVERSRLRPGQQGYLTALDLSQVLLDRGLVTEEGLRLIFREWTSADILPTDLLNSWNRRLPEWFEGTKWQPPTETPVRYAEFRNFLIQKVLTCEDLLDSGAGN